MFQMRKSVSIVPTIWSFVSSRRMTSFKSVMNAADGRLLTDMDLIDVYERFDHITRYPHEGESKETAELVLNKYPRLSEALRSFFRQYVVEPQFWLGYSYDRCPDGMWGKTFAHLDPETIEEASATLRHNKFPIEALLKAVNPAPFGKNDCNSLEILAAELPEAILGWFGTEFYESCMWRVLGGENCIESRMKPFGGAEWEYKLSKMHIHGPGGKFESQPDTVHVEDHVATCMVQLATEYEGGEVTVKHHDDKVALQKSAGEAAMWVFSTDCLHSSAEVTSGWRVVVQYDIYEKSSGDEIDIQSGEDDESNKEGPRYYVDTHRESVQSYFGEYQHSGFACLPGSDKPEMLLAEVTALLEKYKGTKLGIPLFNSYNLGAADMNVLRQPDTRIYEALSKDKTMKVTLRSVIHSAASVAKLQSNVMTVSDFMGGEMASTHLENAEKPTTLLFTRESSSRRVRNIDQIDDFDIVYQEPYMAHNVAYLVVDRVE